MKNEREAKKDTINYRTKKRAVLFGQGLNSSRAAQIILAIKKAIA